MKNSEIVSILRDALKRNECEGDTFKGTLDSTFASAMLCAVIKLDPELGVARFQFDEELGRAKK